jgi:putative membrane protein
MKTERSLITLVLSLVLLAAVSCGGKNDRDSKDMAEEQNDDTFDDSDAEKDTEFAVAAADGGLLEVQLGELAATSASSPQVKQFANMMVDEHSKANEELKTLAKEKNISLPTTLSEKNQERYNDLAKKSGDEFDEAYIDLMVKDHKKDLDEFKKEADKGNDMAIAAWAAGKVPVLQHHLEMAESAQETLKNNKAIKK